VSTVYGHIPAAPELPKVYLYCADIFENPGSSVHPFDYLMIAVAEDGEGLGAHTCTDPSFAVGDLHNQRPRHAAYEARFGGWGDGQFYKVIQIPVGELPPEPVMEAIRLKNEEAAAEGEAR
jgi:hypothetical protein